jgi:hypothetical protein
MTKQQCEMFDEEFSRFEGVLAFAYATYKITKSRLSQLYFDNDESFDEAIDVFHGLVGRHKKELFQK